MKAGTAEHIKFRKLQRRLGLKQYECVGVLESIWLFVARSHFRGDIGASENFYIADAIGWTGDEDELIDALIETGWIDLHPVHRLVVHDWNEHCPNYVKGNISRRGGIEDAPRGSSSREVPKEIPKGQSLEDAPSKPSQAKPSQDITCASEDAEVKVVKKEYTDDFIRFWNEYPKKKSKDYAYKAWKLKKPPIEAVLQKLTIAKKDPQWTKDGGQFIPLPSSWINAGGWKDEEGDLLTQPVKKTFTQHSVNYMGQPVNKEGQTIPQFMEANK